MFEDAGRQRERRKKIGSTDQKQRGPKSIRPCGGKQTVNKSEHITVHRSGFLTRMWTQIKFYHMNKYKKKKSCQTMVICNLTKSQKLFCFFMSMV